MVVAFVKRWKIERSKLKDKQEVLQNRAGISGVSFWSQPCSVRRSEVASGEAAPLAHAHTGVPDSQACCSPAAGARRWQMLPQRVPH